MNGLRKQTPDHVGPPFIAVKLFSLPIWGDHWPRAMTIESSLESGCGLSHRMIAMTLVWSYKLPTHLKWRYGIF